MAESDDYVSSYLNQAVDRYLTKRNDHENLEISYQAEADYFCTTEHFRNLSKAPERVTETIEQILGMKATSPSVELLDLDPFMDYTLGFFVDIIVPVHLRSQFQSTITNLRKVDTAAIGNFFQQNLPGALSCFNFIIDEILFNYDLVANFFPYRNKIVFNSVTTYASLKSFERASIALGPDFPIPLGLSFAGARFEMVLAEELIHSVQHEITEKLLSFKGSRMKIRKELVEMADSLGSEELSRLLGQKAPHIVMLHYLLQRLNPIDAHFSDLANPRKRKFASFSKTVASLKLPESLLDKVTNYDEIVRREIPLLCVAEGYAQIALDELAKKNPALRALRNIEQLRHERAGSEYPASFRNYSTAKHSMNLFASKVNRELGNDAYRIVFGNPPELQELKDPESYLKRVG